MFPYRPLNITKLFIRFTKFSSIDLNIILRQQSYLVVDEMHEKHPELIRDQYWDTFDIELPYTQATLQFQKPDHIGSAADLR